MDPVTLDRALVVNGHGHVVNRVAEEDHVTGADVGAGHHLADRGLLDRHARQLVPDGLDYPTGAILHNRR